MDEKWVRVDLFEHGASEGPQFVDHIFDLMSFWPLYFLTNQIIRPYDFQFFIVKDQWIEPVKITVTPNRMIPRPLDPIFF